MRAPPNAVNETVPTPNAPRLLQSFSDAEDLNQIACLFLYRWERSLIRLSGS
jgi:hypothetical protein